MRNLCIAVCITLLLGAAACSFIAGNNDPEQTVVTPFRLTFVESLRNQKSLRGESLREFTGANPNGIALQRPTGVYADQFRVYATDSAFPDGIFVFERGDASLAVLPTASAQGKLVAPTGIAVDPGGIIFVSDGQQGRVHGFDRAGHLVMVLGRAQAITSRQGLGDLIAPAGLAVDPVRSRLYIADTLAQQVKVYSTIGVHLFDLGNTGTKEDFKFPVAVALDRTGRVYVLDSLRLRVFLFDPEGALLSSFSLRGSVPGQSIKPKGIAVDSDGHVYVIDAVNNNVLLFDASGALMLTWGRTGRLSGDFWTPTGIFIDSHDMIYIADQTNSRIQTFQYTK